MAIELYTWGPGAGLVFLFGGAVLSRPPATAQVWRELDQLLEDAIARCALTVVVVLAPTDAETAARSIYVVCEGGPTTRDVVIGIGHADRSVSWCATDSLIARNEAPLHAVLEEAQHALRTESYLTALASIAPHLAHLRR